MLSFQGFPQDAIAFFEEIAIFNDKTWFEANKERFQESVQQPAQAFVDALGQRLKTLTPGIQYSTSLNGSGSIMRIHRDVRFSKDKTPYKTNLGISWWEGAGKKMEEPGYFFNLDRGGAWIAGGMYIFPKETLVIYRKAVDYPQRGKALTEALRVAEKAGMRIDGIGEYSRVPNEYDKDHPRGELLKKKGIVAIAPAIPVPIITSPALVDVCFDYAKAILPLHQWLVGMQSG